MVQLKFLPQTEKCLMQDRIEDKYEITSLSMLKNERLALQLAYTQRDVPANHTDYALAIESPLKQWIRVYRVEQVPVRIPAYRGTEDPDYISKEPGLYPDLLMPYESQPRFVFVTDELRALYLEIECPDTVEAGSYPICVKALQGDGTVAAQAEVTVTVYDAHLPVQELKYTCWFHSDCLAQYYGVSVFSEEYWRIVRNFVRAAVRDGQNMLLTPVFTPPLDTKVGGERLTVQLVDVTVDETGAYSFGFEKFDRWIAMASEEGIRYFEISHLFTQWGCAHAPKIMAHTPDGYRRIWGWDTDAHGEAYKTFLRAFLTALVAHVKELGIDDRCWYHISDEPGLPHLEAYMDAKNAISDLLEGYHFMDALSNFEFYRTGAVETPIPATNHIEPFLDAQVQDLWTYYCCGQGNQVSNRFLAMPGYRTRILGIQLFKYRIAGFLQWGFNFYNNQGSSYPINPYLETSGDYFVPAGDCFVVYPAPDGSAWPTLHGQQFAQGLNDLRALNLCADLIGFEETLKLVEEESDAPITFSEYPRNHAYLWKLREKVNATIAKASEKTR